MTHLFLFPRNSEPCTSFQFAIPSCLFWVKYFYPRWHFQIKSKFKRMGPTETSYCPLGLDKVRCFFVFCCFLIWILERQGLPVRLCVFCSSPLPWVWSSATACIWGRNSSPIFFPPNCYCVSKWQKLYVCVTDRRVWVGCAACSVHSFF